MDEIEIRCLKATGIGIYQIRKSIAVRFSELIKEAFDLPALLRYIIYLQENP
jgi:hypothetical protein